MGSGSDHHDSEPRESTRRFDKHRVNDIDCEIDDDENTPDDTDLTAELSALTDLISNADSGDTYEGERSCRDAVAKVSSMAGSLIPGQVSSSSTAAATDRDPMRIGPYRLLAKLGEGGMGRVYRARHESLGRTIALKILPPERARRSGPASRFRREVRALGKLNHPNIVAATDGGVRGGVQFLAMELVDGVTLSQVLSRVGPLSVADACELGRQTAVGLAAAHANGMVHRDVKPSNLMLTVEESGRPLVKILDLGLALDSDRNEFTEELTGTGQVVGTIAYMAPEQIADGRKVDALADIYSLGATLTKLLCGKTPFDIESNSTPVQTMVAKSSSDAQSIQNLRDDLPAELIRLIDDSLRLRPDQRPADASEFATRLEPYAQGHDLVALFNRCPIGQETSLQSLTDLPGYERSSQEFSLGSDVIASIGNADRIHAKRRWAWFSFGALVVATVIYAMYAFDRIGSTNPAQSTATISIPAGDQDARIRRREQTMWDITSNLIGYWRIRSDEGEVLIDHSGNGLHQTIDSQDLVINRGDGAALPGDKASLDLGSLAQPITIAHDRLFDTDQLTVSVWIRGKPCREEAYRLVSKSSQTEGFALSVGGHASNRPGRAFFHSVNREQGSRAARSDRIVLDGSWHHLVGTCDGNRQCLYVDGVLNDSVELSEPIGSNNKSLLIGCSRERLPATKIDEIVILNRALSEQEVRFLTANTLAPHPLIAPADAGTAKETQNRWRNHFDSSAEVTNSLGMQLTLVPPGEFTMGTPEEVVGEMIEAEGRANMWDRYRSESPAHRVQIRNAIYVGSHEVTQLQYRSVMGENPSQFSAEGKYSNRVNGIDTSNHPVENVSWFDAIEFCNRLSELEGFRRCYEIDGLDVSVIHHDGYRLPTEAEWEYACRAGTSDAWSYGSDAFSHYEWTVAVAPKRTQPVGLLKPNPFGLYDMHGNVFEWCFDWYSAETYRMRASTVTVDPTGPESGTRRVYRGGSWWQRRTSSRSAFRGNHFPHFVMAEHGFRVVRSITGRSTGR